MDSSNLASGDNGNEVLSSPRIADKTEQKIGDSTFSQQICHPDPEDLIKEDISASRGEPVDSLENNEDRIKERIEECRNIIENLKLELNAEKSKAEMEKMPKHENIGMFLTVHSDNATTGSHRYDDIPYSTEFYSASVDSKLICDENLIQYEKQLQKYQKTLNMAQMEKRNVIRKQMLAKAFKLKLLEIENQCNTELIRVKQSMQCLEPLKLVADSWKFGNDNTYNLDNFELIPRYPEVSSSLAPMKESVGSNILNERGSNNDELS